MNLENYILNKVSKLERVKSESVKLNLVRKWIEDYNDNLKKEAEEEKKHLKKLDIKRRKRKINH